MLPDGARARETFREGSGGGCVGHALQVESAGSNDWGGRQGRPSSTPPRTVYVLVSSKQLASGIENGGYPIRRGVVSRGTMWDPVLVIYRNKFADVRVRNSVP